MEQEADDDDDDFDEDDEEYESTTSLTSLRDKSPFTSVFNDVLPKQIITEDESKRPNAMFCPAAFNAIKDVMHLYPLWSAVLQTEPERFQRETDESDVHEQLHSKCITNGLIEAFFKGVKHGRLGFRPRVRPRIFAEKELLYVQGKLNEQLVPAVSCRKSRKSKTPLTEHWQRRKTGEAKYSGHATIDRLFAKAASVVKPRTSLPSDVTWATEEVVESKGDIGLTEYDDESIEQHLRILREQFPDIAGLESTGLGISRVNQFMPRFSPVLEGQKFVQILHRPDHWLCVTNVFSTEMSEVYVYDIVFTTFHPTTVVQLSSILRLQTDTSIKICIRNFQQQTAGSRLCGLYFVAAAIFCCNQVDVSRHYFDENTLVAKVSENLKNKREELFPSHATTVQINVSEINRQMIYCICQRTARVKRNTIQCTTCV